MAVGMIATPMSPNIKPVNPEIRKAKAIKKTPMMNRKILSPLPTFIILTTNPILSSTHSNRPWIAEHGQHCTLLA
jgi:hypothetical protein